MAPAMPAMNALVTNADSLTRGTDRPAAAVARSLDRTARHAWPNGRRPSHSSARPVATRIRKPSR